MHKQGDEVHIDGVEATGASREGVVRWVLIGGTLLAIVLLSVIWITGALTQDEVESTAQAPERIEAQSAEPSGDDNDGILIEQ